MAQNAGELTRRTTLGVLAAIVAPLVVLAIVDALALPAGATGETSPFAAAPVVISTLVAVLVALHVVAVPLVAFVVGAVRR
ncbi:hypothetical protein NDI85_00575 [Halomicroarcula sp. S1AR25-4]|uniref:hypothetical protein n=1 Tax=Haloarcula sp. S1AR25-4 TaxID=2950538 RepID=UPI0028756AEE|nr:hypothetical protein [Halomicroarcula sp. S1AR25-4]MDS0276297.1 hypothetical protein [Halomicroarcula sp. S1AR25-4]